MTGFCPSLQCGLPRGRDCPRRSAQPLGMRAATPGVILKGSVSSASKRLWRSGSESGDEKQKDNDSGLTEHPWSYFCKSPMQSWKQWSWLLNMLMLTQNHAHIRRPPGNGRCYHCFEQHQHRRGDICSEKLRLNPRLKLLKK